MKLKVNFKILIVVFIIAIISCKKLVEIPAPTNSITTEQSYGTNALAISSVLGMYDYMSWNRNSSTYVNNWITINVGMASDELKAYGGNTTFEKNMLFPDNGDVSLFWNGPYFSIYQANGAIEGLQASTSVTEAVKRQLTGEAKFVRAFAHFYLVNIFGDVPLVTSTSYATNSNLPRTPVNKVFEQIIQDLKDAQELLSDKYAKSDGGFYTASVNRTRPNKAAATALLARVYLYMKDWANAEIQASTVINNSSVYGLVPDLNNTFLASIEPNINTEAIWQLEVANIGSYSTKEGNIFIPGDNQTVAPYFLSTQLLDAFEPGDLRKTAWVGITTPIIDGVPSTYYYPAKFKVRQGSPGNITEYYMPLRLAEQYLIRAEARTQLNKLLEAIADLNIIRARANLPALSDSLTQTQVVSAVAQERRIELFAEWGHRWFDLKRTGQLDNVLGVLKPTWQPYAKLFPIPLSEMQTDPKLVQNPGYQ
jgi:hypothetical protein